MSFKRTGQLKGQLPSEISVLFLIEELMPVLLANVVASGRI